VQFTKCGGDVDDVDTVNVLDGPPYHSKTSIFQQVISQQPPVQLGLNLAARMENKNESIYELEKNVTSLSHQLLTKLHFST
jgi:hypothetical protein